MLSLNILFFLRYVSFFSCFPMLKTSIIEFLEGNILLLLLTRYGRGSPIGIHVVMRSPVQGPDRDTFLPIDFKRNIENRKKYSCQSVLYKVGL